MHFLTMHLTACSSGQLINQANGASMTTQQWSMLLTSNRHSWQDLPCRMGYDLQADAAKNQHILHNMQHKRELQPPRAVDAQHEDIDRACVWRVFTRHLQAALQQQVQQRAACRNLSEKRDSQMFAIGSIELRAVSATCTRVEDTFEGAVSTCVLLQHTWY